MLMIYLPTYDKLKTTNNEQISWHLVNECNFFVSTFGYSAFKSMKIHSKIPVETSQIFTWPSILFIYLWHTDLISSYSPFWPTIKSVNQSEINLIDQTQSVTSQYSFVNYFRSFFEPYHTPLWCLSHGMAH